VNGHCDITVHCISPVRETSVLSYRCAKVHESMASRNEGEFGNDVNMVGTTGTTSEDLFGDSDKPERGHVKLQC
jgi:hypothetical protein